MRFKQKWARNKKLAKKTTLELSDLKFRAQLALNAEGLSPKTKAELVESIGSIDSYLSARAQGVEPQRKGFFQKVGDFFRRIPFVSDLIRLLNFQTIQITPTLFGERLGVAASAILSRDKNQDGVISSGERNEMLIALANAVKDILYNFESTAAVLKLLKSSEHRIALVEGFRRNLDMPQVSAEEVIDQSLLIVTINEREVGKLIDLIKQGKKIA